MWTPAHRPPTAAPDGSAPSPTPTEPLSFVPLSETEHQDDASTYSLDSALDHIGVGKFQIKLILICAFWWAADAMEVMLLSFLLPTLESTWHLHGWQSALIASATFVGILLGSFAWGVIADKLGRRKGFLATALFSSVFGLASCFSNNYITMMILRSLLGFGIGGSPVAFSMLSEFLPKDNRGTFLIFFEVFWTVGTVFEVCLAWIVLPTLGWRWLLGLSSIPLFCLFLCYPLLPESPRYLLISDEYDKAVAVLQQAAQANGAPPLEGTLSREFKETKGHVLELLSPSVRRLSLLLWVLWIAHSVIYYGNVLFTPKFYGSHQSNPDPSPSAPSPNATSTWAQSDRRYQFYPLYLSSSDSFLAEQSPTAGPTASSSNSPGWLNLYVFVLLTTLAELPGLFGAGFLVEKLGRRKTMAAMLGVCLAALFALIFNPPGWVGVILLAISRMGINGSIATLWTFTPEAYPTTLRATGLGVANSLSKLATAGTPFVSTALSDSTLYIAVIIFGLCCVLGIAAALLLPFDTSKSALPSTLGALMTLHKPQKHESNNEVQLELVVSDEPEVEAEPEEQ